MKKEYIQPLLRYHRLYTIHMLANSPVEVNLEEPTEDIPLAKKNFFDWNNDDINNDVDQ